MFSIVMAASMVAAPESTGFFFKFSCGNSCYTHSCATPVYTHGGCCTTTCATPVHVQSTCVTPTYHRGCCGLFSCFKSICHTPVYAAPCGTATPCHPVVVTPATPAPKETPKDKPKNMPKETPKDKPKETPKETPKDKPKQ